MVHKLQLKKYPPCLLRDYYVPHNLILNMYVEYNFDSVQLQLVLKIDA